MRQDEPQAWRKQVVAPRVFITGTDTDVGKTIVAFAVYEALRQLGIAAAYWKPVQTGDDNADINFLRTHTAYADGLLSSAYTYKTPRAPDQAAMIEDKAQVALEILLSASRGLPEKLSIIEGAGGLLVPLNEKGETWVSLLTRTHWPVVVVTRPTLGTINHTSLTLDKLAACGINTLAVVMSGNADEHNLRSLRALYPRCTFLAFETVDVNRREDFLSAATPLAKKIIALLQAQGETADEAATNDAKHVWHPYTQHATADAAVVVNRAKGVWLETEEHGPLFDATSSWWVNTIGHGRHEIAESLAAQQQRLDHTLFAGITHTPAAMLAKKISGLSDGAFERVFFSDNGSTAVEVALKMAYQGFTNHGDRRRTKFLCLKGGYHGDTIGTMAVGGGDGFSVPFQPLLFKATHWAPQLSHPSRFAHEAHEQNLDAFRAYLAENHADYAALIVEPLVQGAGGMLMHDPAWLRSLCGIARGFGLPVIFDEVFTGMGRCGAWFAYQRLQWTPDIVCIAKGLTGGTLPLALTLASSKTYEKFLSAEKANALLHGHSYTANPIACNAALTTLGVYEREALCLRSLAIEKRFTAWIAQQSEALGLLAPRCLGAILAFELPGTGEGAYFHKSADRVSEVARRHGLWLRPLGNTLYLVPPLSVTDEELTFALNSLAAVVRDLSV